MTGRLLLEELKISENCCRLSPPRAEHLTIARRTDRNLTELANHPPRCPRSTC
jgi:hypothetical protein